MAAASSSSSDSASASARIRVVLRNPYLCDASPPSSSAARFTLFVSCCTSISTLKSLISCDYPLQPATQTQRILHRGRLCDDNELLSSLVASNESDLELTLVIKDVQSTFGLPSASSGFPFTSSASPLLALSSANPSISPFVSSSMLLSPLQLALTHSLALSNALNHRQQAINLSQPNTTHSATAAGTSSSVPATQNQPVNAPPAAAVALAPARPLLARLTVFLDLRVLIRLLVIYMLFSPDSGDALQSRLFFVFIVIAFLYQVWRNGEQREMIRRQLGANAPDPNAVNNEEIRERMENGDFPVDLQREREELEFFAQMNRLNRIRVAEENGDEVPGRNRMPRNGLIASVKAFFVGFVASLLPSWRPNVPDFEEENSQEPRGDAAGEQANPQEQPAQNQNQNQNPVVDPVQG